MKFHQKNNYNDLARQLLRLAKNILCQHKSPAELRQMDKYNRKNQAEINKAMRELREKNPDRYKHPGGVSGERRKR